MKKIIFIVLLFCTVNSGAQVLNVALQAIEKAGAKDRKAILQAVGQTKDYEGALGTWSFDENGDTTLADIRGFKVESGKFVFEKYVAGGKK